MLLKRNIRFNVKQVVKEGKFSTTQGLDDLVSAVSILVSSPIFKKIYFGILVNLQKIGSNWLLNMFL